jgi:membrane protease subunit (stomatin/prohibitin family)
VSFFGYMLYKVEDPKLFVTEFFGNRSASTSEDVENYIRGFVIERVIDAFGEYQTTELVRNVDEVTDKITLIINNEARRAGMTIVDTVFEGVKIPEEARRFASGMGQQAMAMQYAKETAQVLPSDGGGAAGAGLGAGLGLGIGAQMMKGMQAEPATQRMVICPNCGHQNPEGNKFCAQCGSPLQPKGVKCPNCGADNPSTNKFCAQCGKPLASTPKNCPKCGYSNQPGQAFCGNCGEKLT